MPWVVRHGDSSHDPATLGGKGASLWSLLDGGFPVPPALCITAESRRLWLEVGQPDHPPEEVLEELAVALEGLASLSWSQDSYAVRSSAVAEDSFGASFAGQLRTELCVPGSQVPSTVVSVWRSADAPDVVAYSDRMGLGPGSMAVVVQPMVPAEASGVVFTAEPITGDPDRVVIDAGWGLGEGVVKGLIAPDHWVVDRDSGRILESRVGDKALTVAAAGDKTETVPTPRDRAAVLTMTPTQVTELSRLALRVESHFGSPQDIEWAWSDGRFWLLQSRPITIRPIEGWVSEFDSDTDPETTWTASNIQEVLPATVTPLDWSLFSERQNYALRKPFLETHTLRDPTTEFVALFYSRAFANVSALRSVASRALGTSPEAVDEQYLGVARNPSRGFKWPSVRQLMAYVDTTPRIIRFLYRTGRQVPAAEAELRPWLDAARRDDLTALSAADLLAKIHEANGRCREMAALHISTTSGASIYFETLGRFLRGQFGTEGQEIQASLVTGLNHVSSSLPALELSRLATLAAGDVELSEVLDGPDAWCRIQELRSPSSAEFQARLARFLDTYGHHGAREQEMAEPAWEEDPNGVLALLHKYMEALPGGEAERVTARQSARRLATTREVKRRLDPLRRLIFRFLLRQAQTYVALREQTKSLWMEVNHCLRRTFRELGRRLAEEGTLADSRDLYFLTFPEIKRLVSSSGRGMDADARIRRRRYEYGRNQGVRLPEAFQGRPNPLPVESPQAAGPVLRGIPVSPGTVTGPARVILDPRGDPEIRPGEVLVAPVTDVGWTPLFLLAAGLVVDIGGPLSHGSIVAREYGLPSVVNVKVATRLVRTGQTITVNGSTGEVTLG